MMRRFTLRASLQGKRRVHVFQSPDDRTAIADGAFEVMRLAYYKSMARATSTQIVWAYGHIELINDLGVIIKEMPAKEYANGGV